MPEAYRDYFAFMEQLGETLDRLTELEKEKAAAARRDDVLGVENCMKREQALSLALRSMDRKRENMLAALGLKNVSLSGLVRHCPQELRRQAQLSVERLQGRYQLYRSAADVARTTLECNLHQIEKLMEAQGGDVPAGGAFADIRA